MSQFDKLLEGKKNVVEAVIDAVDEVKANPVKNIKKIEKPKKLIQVIEEISEIDLNPSAKLNLLKFLYATLENKSTTNKRKNYMKQAVIKNIKKF